MICEQRQLSKSFNFGTTTRCLLTPRLRKFAHSSLRTVRTFTKWRAATDALNAVEDKLEMFDRFATIEDEFEPLEPTIDDTVSDIDRQIQHEIDVMRGK